MWLLEKGGEPNFILTSYNFLHLDSDIKTWNLDNLHNVQQLLLEFDDSDAIQQSNVVWGAGSVR